jgi:putative NADH-flavin reductase
MKKIALFGGSGQTGHLFLKAALEKGYFVKAMVRMPEKINFSHPLLEIIKGDVLNVSDLHAVVEGTDIVVSLFGHVKDSPEWLQSIGTENIIAAMKEYKVRRIISLSGGALRFLQRIGLNWPTK